MPGKGPAALGAEVPWRVPRGGQLQAAAGLLAVVLPAGMAPGRGLPHQQRSSTPPVWGSHCLAGRPPGPLEPLCGPHGPWRVVNHWGAAWRRAQSRRRPRRRRRRRAGPGSRGEAPAGGQLQAAARALRFRKSRKRAGLGAGHHPGALRAGCPGLAPVAMTRPILAGSRDGWLPGATPGARPGRGPLSRRLFKAGVCSAGAGGGRVRDVDWPGWIGAIAAAVSAAAAGSPPGWPGRSTGTVEAGAGAGGGVLVLAAAQLPRRPREPADTSRHSPRLRRHSASSARGPAPRAGWRFGCSRQEGRHGRAGMDRGRGRSPNGWYGDLYGLVDLVRSAAAALAWASATPKTGGDPRSYSPQASGMRSSPAYEAANSSSPRRAGRHRPGPAPPARPSWNGRAAAPRRP
jgi:hypothetical protein